MKAHYKTADGRMQFEVSGDTAKQMFEQVAAVQELFEAETECGVCHSKDGKGLRFVVRNSEKDGRKFKYYELRCNHCFASFHFGQNSEGGGLFPKRRDKDGGRLPNRGWIKFERRQAAAPANGSAQPQAAAPATAGRSYEPDPGYSAGITDDDVPF